MAYLPTWSRVPVKVKLLRPGCQAPKYMTEGAAAADVYADVKQMYIAALAGKDLIHSYTSRDDVPDDAAWQVYRGGTAVIPLGFAIEIPVGFTAVVKGRSGHASRGVEGHVGLVDSDYRLEVHCIVHGGHDGVLVRHGERIGQLAIVPVFRPHEDVFQVVDELAAPQSTRIGGLGSTGR
jgi:dUTPase